MFGVQRESRFAVLEPDSFVGPGTYASERYGAIESQKPAIAGFGRTERNLDLAARTDTGPGSYDIQEVFKAMPSAAFQSRTRRKIEEARNDTPGPGAYLAHPEPKSSTTQRRLAGGGGRVPEPQTACRWERVPTAPSIPGRCQRFGYDEGPTGELVLQEPVSRGYDGVSRSAGPGDYEPRLDSSVRAPNFARSRGHELSYLREKSQTELERDRLRGMPPGAQFCHESVVYNDEAPRCDTKPNAVFRSSVQRDKVIVDDLPGPGTYYADEPARSLSKGDLSFLSKAARFVERPREAAAPDVVDDVVRKRWIGPRKNVGFDSTATRFVPVKTKSKAGPGSYNVPSLADDVAKRTVSRSGAFGTSTRRFAPVATERRVELGVGDGATFTKRVIKQKPIQQSSAFASATARSSDVIRVVGPPPGAYDVSPEWGRKNGLVPFAAASTTLPRRSATADASPGPGAYDVKPTRAKPVVKMVRDSLPSSSSDHPTPGPGAYDAMLPYGNLLKATYNVAIAADCRDLFF